jgi:hypothetical protein
MASNLATLHLSRYLSTDQRSKREYVRQGNKDGSKEIPNSEKTELSAYELGLVADANSSWANYKRDQVAAKNQADKKIRTETHAKDETSFVRIQNEENEKTNKLKQHTLTNGPDSPIQQQLNTALDNSIDSIKSIKTILSRDLQTSFVNVYLPFMIILAIIEIPINKLAFEFFFDAETQFIAFAIAAAIGSMIVFFAHVGGTYLKYSTCKELKPSLAKTYSLILFVGSLSLVLMWVVAKLRAKYLVALESDTQEMLEFDNLMQSGALGDFTLDTLSVDLGFAGYLLLLANIAIFSVGFIAAYMRHDSHPGYEKAENAERKARKNRDSFETRYQATFAVITKEHDNKIENIRKQTVTVDQNLEDYTIEKENLSNVEESDFNIVISGLKKEILAYRQGNAETRKTPEPPYFKKIEDDSIRNQVKRI